MAFSNLYRGILFQEMLPEALTTRALSSYATILPCDNFIATEAIIIQDFFL